MTARILDIDFDAAGAVAVLAGDNSPTGEFPHLAQKLIASNTAVQTSATEATANTRLLPTFSSSSSGSPENVGAGVIVSDITESSLSRADDDCAAAVANPHPQNVGLVLQ